MFLDKKIEVYFQPIISIKEKRNFAFEALTRGFDKENNFISPLELLSEARKKRCLEEFDNYIREMAIKKFATYYKKDKNLLLFLNFESSVIDKNIKNNFDFTNLVKQLNIKESNIVLEIKEDTINSNSTLQEFCEYYKNLGYIIAIDDFGTGYSSFDRLAIVKPDIVKIDRTLIENINKNYINASILKSIVDISHKIGALTLAEGVETNDEILICMKNHIEVYQGFFFEKAVETITDEIKVNILEKINTIGSEYKQEVKNHIDKKNSILKKMKHLTKDIVHTISQEQTFHFEKVKEVMKVNTNIEAIYLIDFLSGNQINDTLIDSISKGFYQASKHNEDHSLKEYYYITKEAKTKEFLSQKYISKATGNMCRTYARVINLNEDKFILCFDILTN
ncbi:EAL domain-containing protein [Malaciobacter mytili]|uniref:EAL domain-containing protein n=1 Tax=Malaciobacter mytili TaxID=603050 RepID=UPI003A892D55